MTCTCMYAVRGRLFHLNVERVGNCALEEARGLAKECDREEGLGGKAGRGGVREAGKEKGRNTSRMMEGKVLGKVRVFLHYMPAR